MDLLERFHTDRQAAFAADDPMAMVCTVANVDLEQQAQMRTLVLREVNDQLAIFINATSPKWPGLQDQVSVLTYWPALKLQYRIQARTAPIDPQIVADSWLLRPPAPKQMDWFYTNHLAQSSPLESRDELLAQVAAQTLPEPLTAPATARGLFLLPSHVERLDLNQENGIHDRRQATCIDGTWTEQVLVP